VAPGSTSAVRSRIVRTDRSLPSLRWTFPRRQPDAGADAFLVKPFGPLELVATVKDLLGVSALLRGKVGG